MLSFMLLKESPRGVGDQLCRVGARDAIGVDDQVILQIVVNLGMEMGLRVTSAPAITSGDKPGGFRPCQVI